jgi:phenylpyruvate tautomerase PptA (4-oxalocrotonate tautomerase family)
MPLVRLQTNHQFTEVSPLMKGLSAKVAELLGKPEAYVMVVVEPRLAMLMAGDARPAALVEVRAVGNISAGQAEQLTAAICDLLEPLGIEPGRVYCSFAGVPGAMWGHDRATFG